MSGFDNTSAGSVHHLNHQFSEFAVPHALKHRRRAVPAYGMARKRWQTGSKRLSMVEGKLVSDIIWLT